ncbi:MAG: response regulator transcription factor [Acidobacteriota bacterium]|nr:response regulator transcription factor [Acidobacteriota bacterium]
MKILIVEDEPGLQLGLSDIFEEAGYKTRVCAEGKTALQWIRDFQPGLVVLDLGLPDMDGTHVLEKINTDHMDVPVLVLTSRASETDVVEGFRLGAFDYVTKPFSPKILLARVDALMRRRGAGGKVKMGDITLDFERYQAERNGEALHLTTREIDLLRFLHKHQGKPVSRHDILDEVWGMESEAGTRTVDTHIAMLRKKVEPNPDRPAFILSQRGIGYKLVL